MIKPTPTGPQLVVPCGVCGKPVPPRIGLYNAHAIVCSWACSGTFNAKRGVNYAWAWRCRQVQS